jgi:hypothetical protein
VETLNLVDAGTSLLVDGVVRADYNAQTALQTVAAVLAVHGLPQMLTFDRDPRWVSSWSSRDFPAPFVRFCYCLGIQPNITPPQQPDKNLFVERYHGTYGRECLDYYRPDTVEAAQEVTDTFKHHYNYQRPNQALSCRNQPPAIAFPDLPVLPRIPTEVDPDTWLKAIDGQAYVRKVQRDGFVKVDDRRYYIQEKLKGQSVLLKVDAAHRQFRVYQATYWCKDVPIKGLYGRVLPWTEYVAAIAEEARIDWHRTQARRLLTRRRAMYSTP